MDSRTFSVPRVAQRTGRGRMGSLLRPQGSMGPSSLQECSLNPSTPLGLQLMTDPQSMTDPILQPSSLARMRYCCWHEAHILWIPGFGRRPRKWVRRGEGPIKSSGFLGAVPEQGPELSFLHTPSSCWVLAACRRVGLWLSLCDGQGKPSPDWSALPQMWSWVGTPRSESKSPPRPSPSLAVIWTLRLSEWPSGAKPNLGQGSDELDLGTDFNLYSYYSLPRQCLRNHFRLFADRSLY